MKMYLIWQKREISGMQLTKSASNSNSLTKCPHHFQDIPIERLQIPT